MNYSCEQLIKLYNLSSGQCCYMCHKDIDGNDCWTVDIELEGVVYYICCKTFALLKDKGIL